MYSKRTSVNVPGQLAILSGELDSASRYQMIVVATERLVDNCKAAHSLVVQPGEMMRGQWQYMYDQECV